MKIRKLFLMFGAFVLPTSDADAQARRQSGGGSNLARIMSTDMLRVQVTYLETITGPARRVFPRYSVRQGQQREYRVNGCDLVAYTAGAEVEAYRLRLSSTCTFNMGQVSSRFPSGILAHQVTFGMIANAFSTEFLPTCLIGCGNAADPAYSIHGIGSRADGVIEVVGTAVYNSAPVGNAAERLIQAARRLMSEDEIIGGRFNCHPRYNEISLQAFRNVRIEEITVGYGLSEPRRC